MIKHKGNIKQSLIELNNYKNEVSYIFNKPKFKNGFLNGATITIKDLIATKEGKTEGSSLILKDFKAQYDATVVKKLKEQGAAIVGKVHCDELGLGATGEYSAFGKIKHPLNSNRIAGGSSSGSIATFSNSISFAIGTDTGDSVRKPASYNGFVGFKPSYGAISRYGVFPYASSLDTIGYFSHNVHDAIILSEVLFGQDPLDMTSKNVDIKGSKITKPKKIAILNYEKNILPKYIQKDFNSFSNKLKKDNIQVEKVNISKELLESIDIVYSIISFCEGASNNSNLTGISFGNKKNGKNWKDIVINTRTKGFGKMIQRRFSIASYFLFEKEQKEIILIAQKVRRLIVNAFNKIYNEYDLLMFPSSKIAPLVNEERNENWFDDFLVSSNFAGTPSISLPFKKHQNMPYGLNLSSKIYSDKKLLSYSLYIEKIIRGENE